MKSWALRHDEVGEVVGIRSAIAETATREADAAPLAT
jgi:hypothetical protein